MLKRMVLLLIMFSLLPAGLAQAQLQDVNTTCYQQGYLTPRLVGGMYARVIADQPVAVYEDFSTSSTVVGQVEPGAVIPINSAPRCVDGVVWWQSNFRATQGEGDTPFGWLPEGVNGTYLLEPSLQALNVPARGQPITAENFGQLQQVVQVEYGLVNDLVWSPDSTHLAISTVGAVWLHPLNGDPALALKPNGIDTNLTTDTVYGTDGARIATAGSSANNEQAAPLLNIWSLADGTAQQTLTVPQREFAHVAAVTRDFSIMATGAWDGKITLWDLPAGTPRATLEGHTLLGLLEFTPDGQTLVSAGSPGMMDSDMTVRFWDVATGTERGMVELDGVPMHLAFNADGTLVAVPVTWDENGTLSFAIQLMDTATGEIVRTLPLSDAVTTLSFDPTGRWLAATSSYYDQATQGWSGVVVLIDVGTGEQVAGLRLDVDLRRVAFSPDGTLLAVVHADPDFWGPDRINLWAVP